MIAEPPALLPVIPAPVLPRSAKFDRPVLSAMETVSQTNNSRILAIVLLLLLIAAIASLFSPWQQYVTGSGRVQALTPVQRQQTLDAPVNGRIVRWHVIEGTRVGAGDLIVELEDNDPNYFARLGQQKIEVQGRLNAAVDRESIINFRIRDLQNSRDSQVLAARSRVDSSQDRVRQSEQNRDAVEARVLQNRLQLERRRQGVQGGVASQRDLEVAQADYNIATADLKRANASLDEARNSLKAQNEDLHRIEADTEAVVKQEQAARAAAQSEIQTQRVSLQDYEVRVSRQQRQAVRAPSSGTIFRLLLQPNSAIVKEGDPIAVFVPDAVNLMAEIDVEGNDMPLIEPGRHVRLQFEGWPAVPFVGWPSVAIGTFGGTVLLVDPATQPNGKFRVMVVPDPKDQAWPTRRFLRQGVRANAFVLLDTVPVGFELWRRLNGFPPVIQGISEEYSNMGVQKKK